VCSCYRDVLPARRPDAGVHAAWRRLLGVVNDSQPVVFACKALEYLARAIVGHAIGDDDLEASGTRLLGQHRTDASLDMATLIAAWNHDRNGGVVIAEASARRMLYRHVVET
jgi:hypothetical protein